MRHFQNRIQGLMNDLNMLLSCFRTKMSDIRDRNYIIDVLGNVSSRFRCIAGDKTFWTDCIRLDFLSRSEEDVMGNEKRLKMIIDGFLSESARDLTVSGDIPLRQIKQQKSSYKHGAIFRGGVPRDALLAKSIYKIDVSKDDIQGLSMKCPNIILLSFDSIKLAEWPADQNHWHSLTELTLSFTNSPDAFRDVQCHSIMPNLQSFKMKEDGCPPIMLPDMTRSHKLAEVELIGGSHQSFCFPFNYKEVAPFPSGLMKLTINMIEFVEGVDHHGCLTMDTMDTMDVLTAIKHHSTECRIKYEFFQNITTLYSGILS